MQHTYTYTVPVFSNLLMGLKNVLTKAEAYCKEKGLDEKAFLSDALAPDMFPLKRQVQVASDQAKGTVSKLTGRDNPAMPDTEETFAELQARIDATLAYLQTMQEADFADAETKQITIKYFPGKYMTGLDFVCEYAIPNFMFHVTTAYAIVRKNGVQIGKADFVGGMTLKDL